MKKVFANASRCLGIAGVAVLSGVSVASADLATMTVPSVETSIMEGAGTAILTAIAVLVAIGMGIRLFKRG